jgi:hypothetical protein
MTARPQLAELGLGPGKHTRPHRTPFQHESLCFVERLRDVLEKHPTG